MTEVCELADELSTVKERINMSEQAMTSLQQGKYAPCALQSEDVLRDETQVKHKG
jgi:hypothetical protein